MSNPYESPMVPEPPQDNSTDGSGAATASLVLGLVSILAWCIPIVGLPVTIAGLICGIKGLGPQKRGTAVAGIVLSIIFMLFTIANAALGVYLQVSGQNPFLPK